VGVSYERGTPVGPTTLERDGNNFRLQNIAAWIRGQMLAFEALPESEVRCWTLTMMRNRSSAGARTQFENKYFTEMCSGSEAGSYLRLIDFVYHSTLGLRVIKKKKKRKGAHTASNSRAPARGVSCRSPATGAIRPPFGLHGYLAHKKPPTPLGPP